MLSHGACAANSSKDEFWGSPHLRFFVVFATEGERTFKEGTGAFMPDTCHLYLVTCHLYLSPVTCHLVLVLEYLYT